MSKKDYAKHLKAIEAIPDDEVPRPRVPTAICLQEAEDLAQWCAQDRAVLRGVGLPAALPDDLPSRIGAARYTQTLWSGARRSPSREPHTLTIPCTCRRRGRQARR